MKLNANLFLAAVAALPTMASAGPAGSCDEQSKCLQFSMYKLDVDSCNLSGDCKVEVCMYVSGSLGADTDDASDNCAKGGSDTFSHMCMQSDSNGCTLWNGSAPLLGSGSTTSCSASGEDDSAAFTGKCSNGNNVLMCQEGIPGDTLYWILKDGNNDDSEDKTYTFNVNGCDNTVSCSNGLYACGGTAAQMMKERTWAFTIPDGSGSCPSVCSPTTAPVTPNNPPTPTPPTPGTTPTPGSNGDPHFKTWKNEHYEYHGQCDMVLTKDEKFADGLGLDIQIRTKMVRFWSYIHNAAVRIGHDIIELEGSDVAEDQSVRYWYNMEFMAKDATTLGGFPMEINRSNGKMTKIEIDLDSKYPGVKIVMSTYKEFVRVDVQNPTEEAFGNTVGLLGEFSTGNTLDRNGEVMHNFREFGSEWQVRPTEHMLFHTTAEPQFPKKCLEPEDPRGERRRRLDESSITMEQAEKACSALQDPLDQKDCIYDILATQDMDMAGAF